MYPVYQDLTTHLSYGKSKLPFIIMHHTLFASYPQHHHSFAELSYVVKGQGVELLGGRPYRIRQGTVSLFLPHQIHETRIETPVEKYNCIFDLNLIFSSPTDHELGKLLLQTGNGRSTHVELDEGFAGYMETIMKQLLQEYQSDGAAKETIIRAKLLEALVLLVRNQRINHVKNDPVSESTDSKLLQVLLYLHIHYAKELNLNDVAKLFNWNASYLSRLFYRYVGQPFTDYLHLLRLGQAVTLLVTTEMKISDISVEVGFDQVRTFIRVFKKWKGTTPSNYRKQHSIPHKLQQPQETASRS